MAKSRKLPKIVVVLLYVLAILVFIIASATLIVLPILGISWMVPILGLAFSIILFGILRKTPKANEILRLLAILWPQLGIYLQQEEKKKKHLPLLRKVEHIINSYNLNDRFKEEEESQNDYYYFSEDFRVKAINKIPPTTEIQFEALKICAEAVENISSPPLTKNVLMTLCLPEEDKEAEILYTKIKKNKTELNDLAEILENSKKLPQKALIPYTRRDILFVLERLDAFSLDRVKEEFEGLQIAWEIASTFREFLEENGVSYQEYSTVVRDLLRTEDPSIHSIKILEKLDTRDRRILTSLNYIGEEKVLKKTNVVKSLNNIALAMFFTEKFPSYEALVNATCKLAAPRKNAVKMAFAYIELREMSRKENKFVSVSEVSKQWKAINKKRRDDVPKGYERDLDVIKKKLAQGEWLTRLHQVANPSFGEAGDELGEQRRRIKKVTQNRPDAINALRRVFDTLSISTIERFLEARTIVAYLLTFNAQEGYLAKLIDSLVKRKPDRYLLLQYIKQSRIGIVPRDTPFQDFCVEFENDLISEYRVHENGKIKGFEMIVHRFGLAGSERYDFDNFNPTAQKKKAGPNIRLLLGDNLNIDGLVEAAGWEYGTDAAGIEKLVSLMLEERISRLVKQQIGGLSPTEIKYLDRNLEAWKTVLADKSGYSGRFIPFAKNLLELANRQSEKNHLAQLIHNGAKIPKSLENLNRCQNIASFYIDTIADIASIQG